MTRVAIVVLNWNGINDTLKCLASLKKQDYKNHEIIIVENGSSDESRITLQGLNDSSVTILYNDKNLGFAGGVNTGISYALEHNFDAVALFNNDAVAEPTWLSSLVRELETNSSVGIVTGLLLHQDGVTIDSTGDFYSTWGMPFPRGRNLPRAQASVSGFVFGASGGASLYRSQLFKKVGLFDETFFAYYEDVDISFRSQLAGYKVRYTDKAIAYHEQGATSQKIPGFTVYQTFKNIPLLFVKNVPNKLFVSIGLRLWVVYILIFINAIRKGNLWPAFKGWVMSIWYTWTNAIWQRWTIQRNKTVQSTYISSILWHDLPPEQTGVRKLLRRGKQ